MSFEKVKSMNSDSTSSLSVGVVIPSYQVTNHILGVIKSIPAYVKKIYVIDDACPNDSGGYVTKYCTDPRVKVIKKPINEGVGGAVLTGYQAAINDHIDIIVKIDGDGQMDPALIDFFVAPIASCEADYTKGNRFFDLEAVQSMPKARLIGNAVLSLMSKLSSGYWDLFDPTNGYTAIHSNVARNLPFKKISRRYFFETDILFRLNTLRAVVVDIPMKAKYGDEVSNLKVTSVIGEFFVKHLRNLSKRIFYNYYLRDMSLASIELPVGVALLIFGAVYGGYQWDIYTQLGEPTPAGTVMMSALPIITGIQLLLNVISFDISSVPIRPIHQGLHKPKKK